MVWAFPLPLPFVWLGLGLAEGVAESLFDDPGLAEELTVGCVLTATAGLAGLVPVAPPRWAALFTAGVRVLDEDPDDCTGEGGTLGGREPKGDPFRLVNTSPITAAKTIVASARLALRRVRASLHGCVCPGDTWAGAKISGSSP